MALSKIFLYALSTVQLLWSLDLCAHPPGGGAEYHLKQAGHTCPFPQLCHTKTLGMYKTKCNVKYIYICIYTYFYDFYLLIKHLQLPVYKAEDQMELLFVINFLITMQVYLRDLASLAPDHCNKAKPAIK